MTHRAIIISVAIIASACSPLDFGSEEDATPSDQLATSYDDSSYDAEAKDICDAVDDCWETADDMAEACDDWQEQKQDCLDQLDEIRDYYYEVSMYLYNCELVHGAGASACDCWYDQLDDCQDQRDDMYSQLSDASRQAAYYCGMASSLENSCQDMASRTGC